VHRAWILDSEWKHHLERGGGGILGQERILSSRLHTGRSAVVTGIAGRWRCMPPIEDRFEVLRNRSGPTETNSGGRRLGL